MSQNWIISITVEEWNILMKNQNKSKIINLKKILPGDHLCVYVRESSNIKGIAKLTENQKLNFLKIGSVNYFGIADCLEFVKDKNDVVKYLKNFNEIANLGRPISKRDLDFIIEHMVPDSESKTLIEPYLPLDEDFVLGSDYEKMFKLENILREFIVLQLEKMSKNWIKERIPDQETVTKWIERQTTAKKQSKWFNEKNYELIHYSDFPDLLTIIITRKNWKDCFEDVFEHKCMFEGKMIELSKIRNDIAHNRNLNKEEKDALDLYSRQIIKLIKSH